MKLAFKMWCHQIKCKLIQFIAHTDSPISKMLIYIGFVHIQVDTFKYWYFIFALRFLDFKSNEYEWMNTTNRPNHHRMNIIYRNVCIPCNLNGNGKKNPHHIAISQRNHIITFLRIMTHIPRDYAWPKIGCKLKHWHYRIYDKIFNKLCMCVVATLTTAS